VINQSINQIDPIDKPSMNRKDSNQIDPIDKPSMRKDSNQIDPIDKPSMNQKMKKMKSKSIYMSFIYNYLFGTMHY